MGLFADNPVLVCEACGRGFVVSPGTKTDPVPVWFTSTESSGFACSGRLVMANRKRQIDFIDQWEKSNAKSQSQD